MKCVFLRQYRRRVVGYLLLTLAYRGNVIFCFSFFLSPYRVLSFNGFFLVYLEYMMRIRRHHRVSQQATWPSGLEILPFSLFSPDLREW